MPPTALAVRLSAAPAYVQPQIFTTPFVVGRLPEQRELSWNGLEQVEVSGLIPLDVEKLPHKGTTS